MCLLEKQSLSFFIQNSIFQSNFDLKTPRKEHKHLENPINDLKKPKKKKQCKNPKLTQNKNFSQA
jgi:hypothetical protein